MPDKHDAIRVLYVGFTPPSGWTYYGAPIVMDAAGTIVLVKDDPRTEWTFVDAYVENGGTQFHSDPPIMNGAALVIRDHCENRGSWTLSITVQSGNGHYTNTDGSGDVDPPPRVENEIGASHEGHGRGHHEHH